MMSNSNVIRSLGLLWFLSLVAYAGCALPRAPRPTDPPSTVIAATEGATISVTPTVTRASPREASPEPILPTAHATSGVGTATPRPSVPTTAAKPQWGVQLHVPPRWDSDEIMASAQDLGVGWVKEQVQWHTIEHGPEDFEWHHLDEIVRSAETHGLKLLLGVTHAPDWTRPVEKESGPPADYGEFGRFMEQLATRYRGQVDAYELWNEPNLAREWRGDTLDASRFVALVAEGADGVRLGDPEALVVSGAPAVTGIDDGVTAVADRRFLRNMIEAGVADHVDAIGAHPYGYGNPPEESVHDETHAASSHNDHPTFFFRDTLEDYRGILVEHGLDDVPIWITEFGWPSPEGIGEMDLTGWEYGREISEADQATYVVRAFRMGQERPGVGPMFLWNLNLAVIWGPDNAFSAYSLLRPDGSLRPAYLALRAAKP